MKKILLLQGANLNYLGKRDPHLHGSTTADQLNAMLQQDAQINGYHLEIFYSNHEGMAIDRIYQAKEEEFDGLVMNPAGFSYAGYALRDCILGVELPYIEIHVNNIAKRNIHCVLSDISVGLITGFGIYGYILALNAMRNLLTEK